jgi:hypothetical protein
MTKEPEMILGYGNDGDPVSAACSLCGEWMPEDYVPDATAPETLARFIEHFNAHVREKHGPQYLN